MTKRNQWQNRILAKNWESGDKCCCTPQCQWFRPYFVQSLQPQTFYLMGKIIIVCIYYSSPEYFGPFKSSFVKFVFDVSNVFLSFVDTKNPPNSMGSTRVEINDLMHVVLASDKIPTTGTGMKNIKWFIWIKTIISIHFHCMETYIER